jgi:hypothetical protein
MLKPYGLSTIYLDIMISIPKDFNYIVFVIFSDCPSKRNVQENSKIPFHFEHSWIMLRFHPKWVAHMESVKPKNNHM